MCGCVFIVYELIYKRPHMTLYVGAYTFTVIKVYTQSHFSRGTSISQLGSTVDSDGASPYVVHPPTPASTSWSSVRTSWLPVLRSRGHVVYGHEDLSRLHEAIGVELHQEARHALERGDHRRHATAT